MTKHIAVIGGGLAGTSAAYWLRKHGYEVTIIEKNARLGGRIHTVDGGGVTIELGAGFMTRAYTNVFQFLKEVNLYDDLQIRKSKGAITRDGISYKLSPQNLLLRGKPIAIGAQIQLLLVWQGYSGNGTNLMSMNHGVHIQMGQRPWRLHFKVATVKSC